MTGIESLPEDLITKIFSNLPAKSVAKFRCLSKLWASTLGQSYFTDLFLTMSTARPHLLFSLWPQQYGDRHKWCCLSSPQPQNPDVNSSIVVDPCIGFSFETGGFGTAPVSGFYCLLHTCDKVLESRIGRDKVLESRIGNPTTGQYVDLPILSKSIMSWQFFGYDPIGKQYKLLSMSEGSERCHLLTFPFKKNESWRSIKCPTRHEPFSSGRCINGFLYYVGRKGYASSDFIVCFDVRYEEFKFIDEPEAQTLWNKRHGRNVCLTSFNRKLVLINWHSLGNGNGRSKLELYVWILEDDKKPEWSKRVYQLTLPFDTDHYNTTVCVVGMIGTGEIVLSMMFVTSIPFYVFYFNPKRNTLKQVKVQGIEAYKNHTVTIYLDHVENLRELANSK